MLPKPTAENLRRVLKRRHWTQAKAAGLIHSTEGTLRKYAAPPTASSSLTMPMAAWELLLLKAGMHPTHKLKPIPKAMKSSSGRSRIDCDADAELPPLGE